MAAHTNVCVIGLGSMGMGAARACLQAGLNTWGVDINPDNCRALLAAGAKGKRKALPNAEIMIHQPSGGARGQATDIAIQAEQILKTKKKMNQLLSEMTGQPLETIAKDVERDNYMDADEALKYGLIDEIIPPRR